MAIGSCANLRAVLLNIGFTSFERFLVLNVNQGHSLGSFLKTVNFVVCVTLKMKRELTLANEQAIAFPNPRAPPVMNAMPGATGPAR